MGLIVEPGTVVRCTRRGLSQVFLCGDLEDAETRRRVVSLLPPCVAVVYSDPPWNPGNATYWRTHAGMDRCVSYDAFLDGWTEVVVECIARGARDVLCEQSVVDIHRAMHAAAVDRRAGWNLPLAGEYVVYYGSPGSRSCRRPNKLLHYGWAPLDADPSDMHGEPMTIRVCAGLGLQPGETIVDPCMGKGMTSRMAHYFGLNCVGSEINPKRLAVTVDWLDRQGYSVEVDA